MKKIGLNSESYLNFKSTQEIQNQQFTPPQQMSEIPLEQNFSDIPLPDIYEHNIENIDDKSIKKTIKKFDLLDMVSPWIEHPLLMIPTSAGLAWGVEKFSNACAGDYEKSLVGKVANLGTSIQESKFVNSKPIKAITNGYRALKIKAKKMLAKSDLLSSIWKTPSKPEWSMVKDEMLSIQQRVVRNFTEIPRGLQLTAEGAVPLEKLAVGNKEKEFFKDFFKNIEASNEMKSNALQLKNLGMADDAIREIINKADATNIVKAETLKKMGLTTENLGMDVKAYLEKLAQGNINKKDIQIITKACEKGRGICYADGHQSFLGPLQVLKHKVGVDEYANRLKSMTEGKSLGKKLSSFLQKCHRGFFFGGGKTTALLWVSPMLVRTMIDVKNAEPKDKIGTGAHGLIHAVSWVFTFPLALKAMHHLAGMQYAGMGPKKVEKMRKVIETFNKRVTAGEFLDNPEGYQKALKFAKTKVKALKRVKDQNLLTKIGRKLGSFITMDLETFKSFNGGNFITRTLKKIPNSLKNIGGVPTRLIIWGMISVGLFDTIINKGIKTIFGNYYDRFKQEENVENKKAQKKFTKEDLKNRLKEIQRDKMLGVTPSNTPERNVLDTKNIPPEVQAIAVEKMKEAAIESKIKENTTAQEENNTQIAKTSIPEQKPITTQDDKLNDAQLNPTGFEKPTEQFSQIAPQPENKNIFTQVKNPAPEKIMQEKNTNDSETKNSLQIDNYAYMPKEKSFITQQNIQKRDNYTYIPSSKNLIQKENNKTDEKKYIPSQIGVKFNKTFDNSGLEAALRRADRAEKKALQTLAGNFNAI